MTEVEKDPMSKVYDALWTMLENHSGFAGKVKIGNRIKYSGENRDPEKQEILDGDLPEVRIIPVSGDPHLQRTSNSSSFIKMFELQITTGDPRVDAAALPVEWEVYKGFSTWEVAVKAITWHEMHPVNLCRLISVAEGASEKILARGHLGWAALIRFEVHFWFRTIDLQTV